jgi:hypothetical protein
VALRHGDEQRLVLEPLDREPAWVLHAQPDREVEPAGAQVVEQRPGRLLAHVQAQPRVALPDGVEQRFEAIPGARREPDGQVSGLAAAGRTGRLERLVDRAQRGPGRLQQRLPGLRELHPAGRPLQQRDAQLLLEPGDRGAQRLLGDVDAAGGAGEVQLLGDGDEVAQVPQLHIHSRGV